jgi:phosphatidylglycerol:prolipoprotein diacylglycerol transferase
VVPTLLRFEIAGWAFRVNGYGLAAFCGAAAALILLLRRAREANLPHRALLTALVVGVAAGFVGARLAYAIQFGVNPLRGGLVLYGGLAAGMASGLAFCRWRGWPALRLADLAAPCALVAVAFGRLGCCLAGCCFGSVAGGGLSYPPGSHAYRAQVHDGLIVRGSPDSLPTVPAPLLECAALLLIAAAASLLWRRGTRPGTTLAACGILYPAWRFVAEFWRGDHRAFWGSTLTFSQGVSLALVAVSVAFLLCRRGTATRPAVATWARALPAQAAFLLALVVAFTGAVSCRSAPRMTPMSGEFELRSQQGLQEKKRKSFAELKQEKAQQPKQKDDDDDDSLVEDCLNSCTDSCIESCSASCSAECSNEDCEGTTGVEAASSPSESGSPSSRIWFVDLDDPVELTAEGTLNNRLKAAIKVRGILRVKGISAQREWSAHLAVSDARVTVGEFDFSGAGEVDLKMDRDLPLTIVRSTLPKAMQRALKAMEPLTNGLIRVEADVPADPDIVDLVQRETKDAASWAACAGAYVVRGRRQKFKAVAELLEDPSGRRFKWSITE